MRRLWAGVKAKFSMAVIADSMLFLIAAKALWRAPLVFMLLAISAFSVAGVNEKGVMTPDFHDQASLQRGLQIYSNYCSGCHQLQYMRYKTIAQNLDIPNSLFAENLLPKYARISDQITSPLTAEEAIQWFGAKAPDLTLEAKRQSPDWIYRYLQGFYQDKTRPLGVNNLLVHNVSMPNVLEHLQGERRLDCQISKAPNKEQTCRTVAVARSGMGKLSDEDFKQVTYDVANFLAYTSDPSRLERESLGLKVLLFIVLFGVFAYLLKKEFWRDVK